MTVLPKYRDTIHYSYIKECGLVESSIEVVFGVTKKEIASMSRRRPIVEARMAFFSLFRKYFRISTKQLGALYNRDHTTVLYNLQVCEDLRKVDRVFDRKFCSAEVLVREGCSVLKSEVMIEQDKSRLMLWYCVDRDGKKRAFLKEPVRCEHYWKGLEVQIGYQLFELFPESLWENEPIMVEIKIVGQTIQEKKEL